MSARLLFDSTYSVSSLVYCCSSNHHQTKAEEGGEESEREMKLPRSNDDLVEYMKKHGMVKTPAILEAFRVVDRGDFATPHLGQVMFAGSRCSFV